MTTSPKLFISYSWTSQEYQQWVLELAEKLRADGVDVRIDKWDLKPGHDAYYFMEQIETDEKVIIICDQEYATKANQRKGGVGTETQIITPELFNRVRQNKFVAVVVERDKQDNPYLPIYLKGRIFIDLSKPERYEQGYEELLRWVFEEPKHVKPPLGKKPSFESFNKKQAIFSVPHARPELFVGRKAVLQHLEDGLQTHHQIVLTGLGGMGKTHTAVQFAYLHRHEYQAVLWLSAANVGLITSEFAKLVTVLKLPVAPDAKDDEKFHAVQQWLETHSQWLLVIDNADEWRETWQSVKWLTALKGKVLFTSRDDAVKPAEQVKLAEMIDSEAVACLLQRALTQQDREAVTAEEQTQLQQFCMEALGGLPLALNQAGAYIEQTRCGLRGYMQRFQQHAMKLLAKPGDVHDPVATTFDLSLEQVAQRNAAAVELLRICAFLDSDQIAEEIFLQGAEQLGEPLQVLQQDELELDEMLEALLRYSLIKREATGLSMHRLLQRVVRHQLPQPKEYATRAMNAVNAVFPNPQYFENWSACERLLPSAAACCHHILKYAIATETAGRLLNKTAYYLYDRKANYAQALPLFQEASEIWGQVLGKHHPDYALSLNNLAALYKTQGQYAQVRPLLKEASEIWGQVLGKQHPDYALSLNNLAALYDSQGQYEQALPLYQEASEIREQVLGKQHPDYASSLNNLAVLYKSQGQYEQALPLYQEALKIREQVLGQQHPHYAQSLNNLAVLYKSQGQYEQALPLFQEASEIWGHVLGKQHPEYACSLNNLAELYYSQGQYEQALPLYQEASEIWGHVLGKQHPEYACSLNNLAELYRTQGRYEQALLLFQEALKIREQALGKQHPDYAQSLNNLAVLYYSQGQYEQALPLYQEALKIREHVLGKQHPDYAQSLNNLAQLYYSQGQYEQALPLYQVALDIFINTLGAQHPSTKKVRGNYEGCLERKSLNQN